MEWLTLVTDIITQLVPRPDGSLSTFSHSDAISLDPLYPRVKNWSQLPISNRVYKGYGGHYPHLYPDFFKEGDRIILSNNLSVKLATKFKEYQGWRELTSRREKISLIIENYGPIIPFLGNQASLIDIHASITSYNKACVLLQEQITEHKSYGSRVIINNFYENFMGFNKKRLHITNTDLYCDKKSLNLEHQSESISNFINYLADKPEDFHKLCNIICKSTM